MPIHFTCPHCGNTTEVLDQYAGQTGPCAHCGKTVTIPPAGAGAAMPMAARRTTSTSAVVAIVAVSVLIVVVFCGGILVALLLPAVQSAREAARRARCLNNLKQIELAMSNYETQYGCLPPAYLADENGKPMHSWRVLLLPYLGQQALYNQYDFDEPWDSPGNKALIDLIPKIYQCPSTDQLAPGETNYAVIVGPGMVFDGDKSSTSTGIQDGASNTLMVVEVPGGITWTEPQDLDATQMSYSIDDPSGDCIGSSHPGGANVGMCDGSVHFLDEGSDPATVKKLANPADGAAVPWGSW